MSGSQFSAAIARCWGIRNSNVGRRLKLGKNENLCNERNANKTNKTKEGLQNHSKQSRPQNKMV